MNAESNNPFDLENETAYQQWRTSKLSPLKKAKISPVSIDNPDSLSIHEYNALSSQIGLFNMAIFKLPADQEINSDSLKAFGAQVGLQRLDSNLYASESDISELRVVDKGRRGEYIPYTNRPLGWHTDGYYNNPDKTIRAFILYCANNAAEGGANQLLDPELAYIYLRDLDTNLIDALMQPDAFTIPETVEDGVCIRPEQKNPVFQIDPASGDLLMRYTQRKTHIQWREDDRTQKALSLLGGLLAGDSDHILNVRLNPGEGLICNNVLHNRSAFTDNPEQPRTLLRARYYDRFRESTYA